MASASLTRKTRLKALFLGDAVFVMIEIGGFKKCSEAFLDTAATRLK